MLTLSATLLSMDAWFDVTTARRGDVLPGIVLAGLLGVPSALLLWVAHCGLRHIVMMPATSPRDAARSKTFDDLEQTSLD